MRNYTLCLLSVMCIFAVETTLASECPTILDWQIIHNSSGWDAIDYNVTRAENIAKLMGATRFTREDLTFDDFTEVSIGDLFDVSIPQRVLHLMTHGIADGGIGYDAFETVAAANARADSLKSKYFLTNDHITVSLEQVGTLDVFYVILTVEGQRYIAETGFEESGAVIGWYSWATAGNGGWPHDNVVSLTGNSDSSNPWELQFSAFYENAGCQTNPSDADASLCGNNPGTLCTGVVGVKRAEHVVENQDGDFEVRGDAFNSLRHPDAVSNKTDGNFCSCENVAVALSDFGLKDNNATWNVQSSIGTRAFRVMHSGEDKRGSRRVVSHDVPLSEDDPSYATEVSEHTGWFHLEESYPSASGEIVWRNASSHYEASLLQSRSEAGSQNIVVHADRENQQAAKDYIAKLSDYGVNVEMGSAQKSLSDRNENSIYVEYSDNQLSRKRATTEKVLIVAAAQLQYWEDEYFLKPMDAYKDALVQYGGFDSSNVVIYYNDQWWHDTDSTVLANRIISGDEDYVLLFGNVELYNERFSGVPGDLHSWGTDPPFPWILDESFEDLWRADNALSLADWEVHDVDGNIEKAIGFLPIVDSADVWNHYYKYIDYMQTQQSGYEHTYDVFGYDATSHNSGVYNYGTNVRSQSAIGAETVHPYWDMKQYLWTDYYVPGPQAGSSISDTLSLKMQDGSSHSVVLGTGSSTQNLAKMIGATDPLFTDDLDYTHKYSHVLGLSCFGANVDYYQVPLRSSAEVLMTAKLGGAISLIGPTRAYFQYYYFQYWNEYVRTLNAASGPIAIGDLHNQVRAAVVERDGSEAAQMFSKITILVGDPTIPVFGLFGDPVVGVDSGDLPTPETVRLRTAPNPFNPRVAIYFDLDQASIGSIEIYDVAGRLIKRIQEFEFHSSGTQYVEWGGVADDGQPATSGVYFVRLVVDGSPMETNKVVLVR